jgi:hypothetical protein
MAESIYPGLMIGSRTLPGRMNPQRAIDRLRAGHVTLIRT